MSKTIRRKKTTGERVSTTARLIHRFFLLGGNEAVRDRLGREQTFICSSRDRLLEAIEHSTQDSVWISSKPERTEELLQTIGTFLAEHHGSRRSFGSLFMLESPRARILPSLHGCFGRVIGEVPSFKTLHMEQLVEVFSASEDKARDVFIGGIVDRATGTLALVRGNLERMIVPLSMFQPSGRLSPDFRFFELDDYGQTLRFGEYEATADVVLWEADPDYRKRTKAKERALAEGFGASLRRLRKQRGLSQSDFPNVARKTIYRIEKSGQKPGDVTLNRIAKALGVSPEEIETY